MNKALMIYPSREDWELCKELGEYAWRSTIGDKFQSAIKIRIGQEMGIPTAAALNGLYIIEGKPSIAPKLAWAMIQNHPEFDLYTEKRLTDAQGDFYGWDIMMKRSNGVQATRRFTIEDAKRISLSDNNPKKLIEKYNWKNYPEDVCYWRAQARVHSAVFPDVAMGMNRSDELGADITPDGDVIIDITPEQVIETPISAPSVATDTISPIQSESTSEVTQEPQIPNYDKSLADLFKMASQDEIIEAHNEESLPVTPEQVNITWHNLIQSGKIVEVTTDLNETVEDDQSND